MLCVVIVVEGARCRSNKLKYVEGSHVCRDYQVNKKLPIYMCILYSVGDQDSGTGAETRCRSCAKVETEILLFLIFIVYLC
jgi:hypothetical protein